ncbi:DNA-3-methyladenine glycosylase II [Desulfocucumis palustris]|uniref:DNA-3-methyladenine glycosylase II n=1 Tax=Desulfocucumis palustris TaxID=1898651 RepID=A0A2L2XJF1_9FIRM|nr:DNA-3-methyladenine glycosylase [Desulfocucumis palustris]GBF34061.1 DNA-3-methyladenine glycosylase II [Desulfocucumis palustris]
MLNGNIVKIDCKSPEWSGLKGADWKLGELLDLLGDYTLNLKTDYFGSLVRSILGQQLSVKAAATIWNRTVALCGKISPETVLSLDAERLREAGLSKSKISYIKDLAQKVLDGEILFQEITGLPDQQVIENLTRVKGIGRWTAEMFLIFSLGRPDVFSPDDFGLRRGIKWLYGLDDLPGKVEVREMAENWKPFRTAASLYIWEAINRGLVDGGYKISAR